MALARAGLACGAEILRRSRRSAQDVNPFNANHLLLCSSTEQNARVQKQPYRSMYTMLGVFYTARVRSDQKAIERTQS